MLDILGAVPHMNPWSQSLLRMSVEVVLYLLYYLLSGESMVTETLTASRGWLSNNGACRATQRPIGYTHHALPACLPHAISLTLSLSDCSSLYLSSTGLSPPMGVRILGRKRRIQDGWPTRSCVSQVLTSS